MAERVLITGGGGYIGGILVPLLLDKGYEVTVVDTFAHGVNTLAACCANPAFDAYRIDARDEARLRPLVQKADWIIPLAALVGAPLCDRDPLGAGYHIIQSMIAIGSGGIWGKGLFQGTQTQLHFIPEQHTDFIFSVIAEELGMIGGITVLLLFLLLFWRGLAIANQSKDEFGSLIAAGIVSMLTFHVFVNMGMTMGIMPVTGIPLPLISYGGTSLLTNFAALGLLQSIAMRKQRLMF